MESLTGAHIFITLCLTGIGYTFYNLPQRTSALGRLAVGLDIGAMAMRECHDLLHRNTCS